MPKQKLNARINNATSRIRHYVQKSRLVHRIRPASSPTKRWSRPTSLMLQRVEDLLLHGRVIKQGDMSLHHASLFRGVEWHKHSFVLCDNKLYFFSKRRNSFPDGGVIAIPNVTSLKAQDLRGSKAVRFCVQIFLKNREPLVVQCATEEERNSWLTALLATKAMSMLKELRFK